MLQRHLPTMHLLHLWFIADGFLEGRIQVEINAMLIPTEMLLK